MDRSQRTTPCSRDQFLSRALPFHLHIARKKGLGMIKNSKPSPPAPTVQWDRSTPPKLRWPARVRASPAKIAPTRATPEQTHRGCWPRPGTQGAHSPWIFPGQNSRPNLKHDAIKPRLVCKNKILTNDGPCACTLAKNWTSGGKNRPLFEGLPPPLRGPGAPLQCFASAHAPD